MIAEISTPAIDTARTHVRDEARADARNSSRDALRSGISLFLDIVSDVDANPVEHDLARVRLRAFTSEMERREPFDRATTGNVSQFDREFVAWDRLRFAVKEAVDVPAVLEAAGINLFRAGRSRGREEYASPCPLCGGDDRLRSWSGPNGRVWCRQCQWSGDVIAAASLIVGTGEFRDSLRWLANFANLDMRAIDGFGGAAPHG